MFDVFDSPLYGVKPNIPRLLNLEDLTDHKNALSEIFRREESSCKCLKRLVGASGFEPPTSWSRTRRSSQAEPRPEEISA